MLKTTIGTLSTNSGTKGMKIDSRRVSSLASWIYDSYFKLLRQEASQDIQPKSNESTKTGTNHEKLASRRVSSYASWMSDKYFKQARSFPRNKNKIKRKSTTEILASKITERKFNREFCWKVCYKRLEFKWKLKHFDKTKKPRKYSNSKNFVSRTLSDKFPQNALKFATLYLFYPFLSRFFCIKFPL